LPTGEEEKSSTISASRGGGIRTHDPLTPRPPKSAPPSGDRADSSSGGDIDANGRGPSQAAQPRPAAVLEGRLVAAIAEAELDGRKAVADVLTERLRELRAATRATVIDLRARQR